MPDVQQLRAALDDDDVRHALVDALHARTGQTLWLVDEEHRSDVRPCVAGQADTVCWQFADGSHVHVCLVPRAPWREARR